MTTMRDDFEAWYRVMFAENPNSPEALMGWLAYQAATERAAKVVEAFPHWLGETGRVEIAAAIRGGERSKE